MAALQSFVDSDEVLTLEDQSNFVWGRERIENAVPPDAAESIIGLMTTTLLLAMFGETFVFCSPPIWVQLLAVEIVVDQRGNVPTEAT